MKKAIYTPVIHGQEEELFRDGMRDMVLQTAPPSLFGPLVAILAPHTGQSINAVICTVIDLGEVDAMQAWKGV